MTREEFIKLLEERGDIVYILDRGLLRFGKFAATIITMFALIGIFLFGIDIKKALEETKEARFETQRTLLELGEAKKQLASAEEQLNELRSSITVSMNRAREEMERRLAEIRETNKRALGIEQEIISVRLRMPQTEDAKTTVLVGTSAKRSNNPDQLSTIGRIIHVALVSDVDKLPMADLTRVAAALQKQVTRDLKPIWNIEATVEAYQKLETVPIGHWPIIIQRDIGIPGAAGTHQEKDGAPFGLGSELINFSGLTIRS